MWATRMHKRLSSILLCHQGAIDLERRSHYTHSIHSIMAEAFDMTACSLPLAETVQNRSMSPVGGAAAGAAQAGAA